MHNLNAINIRALLFFISVYNCKSFSVVARCEGVSPSMVSRIIQQLEESLGCQLFYRNTRAIMPTEAGRIFIEYARSITEQLTDVSHRLHDMTAEPQGLIRINAPVFFGQHHIAPWLAGFLTRYPSINIELTQTDEFIDPHTNAADVIFRIGSLHDTSLHARTLGTQTYHLAASPAYIKKHGIPTTPADLDHHRNLVYRGYTGKNRWLFKQPHTSFIHQPISPTLVSNNAETLLISALNDMGIVLFPDWLIGEHLKQGTLITLLNNYEVNIKTESQYIIALYPHARKPPLTVRALIDYFVEVYGDTPYWRYHGAV
jgi:DNA-binding transcriptional LysR family regulator